MPSLLGCVVSPGCPEAEEANSPHMESDASPSLPGGKHSVASDKRELEACFWSLLALWPLRN